MFFIRSLPSASEVLAVPDTHLHLYGKSPRPGRKVGHITVRAETESELWVRVRALQALNGVCEAE